MGKLFEKAFGVRPDEQPLVAGFFFLFVIIGMFYTVGVAVGDTLFLANVSAEEMPRLYPWVYVGIAAGTIGWAVAHHRLQAKISRFAYVVGTQLGIGLAVVVLRQLCELDTSWMFFILLVCLEVSALVYITLFFSFAGDYFSPRAARRVFGVIVGGMAVGTVAAGYLVRHAVDLMDTPDLLYVAAGLAMLGTLVSSLLFRIGTPLEDAVVIDERQVETLSVRHLARQRYLRAVGIAVTLTLVMAVLVDYQMKWVASDLPEAELAVFFGGFYEWVGLAQLAFQVLLVPPSLRILGIINCLLVFPILVGVGAAIVFVGSGYGYWGVDALLVVGGVNFLRMVMAETLDRPSRELLFSPLNTRLRVRAQALMGEALAPGARGLGGVLVVLLIAVGLDVEYFPILAVLCAVLAVAVLVRLRPLYRQTLAASLKAHELDQTDIEDVVRNVELEPILNELLHSDDEGVVRFTISMLDGRPLGGLGESLVTLIAKRSSRVAVAAIARLSEEQDDAYVETFRQGLSDARPAVRVAATLGLCRALQEDAADEAVRLFRTVTGEQRDAAIVGLARDCGLAGLNAVRGHIEGLCHSAARADRAQGASLIGRIGAAHMVPLLEPLLRDPADEVSLAAIEAASEVGVLDLVPPLLLRLDEPSLHDAAVGALAAMPDGVVALLSAQLEADYLSTERRIGIARVMAQKGGRDAVRALWSQLGQERPLSVRLDTARALRQLRVREGLYRVDLPNYRARIMDAVGRIEVLLDIAAASRHVEAFVSRCCAEHARLYVELVLNLLAVRFAPRQLERARFNLLSDAAPLRAGAVELVEEVLPRRWVRRVCPTLQRLVRDDDETRWPPFADSTLQAMAGGDTWMRVMSKALVDTNLVAPALANSLVLRPEEVGLLRVWDRVQFLKNIRLFEQLPVVYLGSVAKALEVSTVKGQTVIFEEGDHSANIYLIESGAVRVEVDGNEVAFLPAGESLGELAVLDGSPRSATVVSIGRTRLLRLPGERFRALLVAHGTIARAMMCTLDARIRDTLAINSAMDAVKGGPERALSRSAIQELPDLERLVSIVSFLQQVDLFATLPTSCLLSLARIVREVRASKGDVLFEQGDVGRSLYLLCAGVVSIRIGPREVARLEKNASFGGMSLISGRTRSATAVVRRDARLLQIWSEEFYSLVTTEPSFALALLRTLSRRLRHVSTTVLEPHESDWGSMS